MKTLTYWLVSICCLLYIGSVLMHGYAAHKKKREAYILEELRYPQLKDGYRQALERKSGIVTMEGVKYDLFTDEGRIAWGNKFHEFNKVGWERLGQADVDVQEEKEHVAKMQALSGW